ncbi:hypothetical protein SLS57_009366 [Botryosphaeria dothidea]
MSHFALTFTIDPARQYLVINSQQRIALQNANTLERFSAPIPVTAPVGDPPSFLSSFLPIPPWFHRADALLLSWAPRPESTILTLRASWSANGGGPMEVWPDGDSWEKRWLPPRGRDPEQRHHRVRTAAQLEPVLDLRRPRPRVRLAIPCVLPGGAAGSG